MNTAKNLQLLDAQSNNISPATNIESLYYEINLGGVIYRNALYRHFPVYVKYNNNLADAYNLEQTYSKDGNNAKNPLLKVLIPTGTNIIPRNASTYLVRDGNTNDILVSSIRQTTLPNTRYYKLEVTTYNLSDILNIFAPRNWVDTVFLIHDTSIHNIIYESTIVANEGIAFTTTKDVGNIHTGTDLRNINGHTLNSILDNIFVSEQYPKATNPVITLTNLDGVDAFLYNISSTIDLKILFANGLERSTIMPVYYNYIGGTPTLQDKQTNGEYYDASINFKRIECQLIDIKNIVTNNKELYKDSSYIDRIYDIESDMATFLVLYSNWFNESRKQTLHTNYGEIIKNDSDFREVYGDTKLIINDICGLHEISADLTTDKTKVKFKGTLHNRIYFKTPVYIIQLKVGTTSISLSNTDDYTILQVFIDKVYSDDVRIQFTLNLAWDMYIYIPSFILPASGSLPRLARVKQSGNWVEANNWQYFDFTEDSQNADGTAHNKEIYARDSLTYSPVKIVNMPDNDMMNLIANNKDELNINTNNDILISGSVDGLNANTIYRMHKIAGDNISGTREVELSIKVNITDGESTKKEYTLPL